MNELEALQAIDLAFSGLDDAAKARTLHWLMAKYPVVPAPVASNRPNVGPSVEAQPRGTQFTMTARAVATTLGADNGADLVQAAAAFLTVVQGRETFSRQELLEAMKSATGFFKPTYRKSLSGFLESLCKKNVLIEVSSDAYAIKAGALSQISQRLQASLEA